MDESLVLENKLNTQIINSKTITLGFKHKHQTGSYSLHFRGDLDVHNDFYPEKFLCNEQILHIYPHNLKDTENIFPQLGNQDT